MSQMKKLIGLFILTLFLVSGVNAVCTAQVSNFLTEVRNTSGFYEQISAPQNTDVDVLVSFVIDSFSDCASTSMTSKAIISKLNQNTGLWEVYSTAYTQTAEISGGTSYFQWNNIFNTQSSSTYTQYKIEGILYINSVEKNRDTAYVDVVNDSCNGIELIANNFTINEGITSTRTISVVNNTSKSFSISTVDVTFPNAIISSGSTNYDSLVYAHSNEPISITFNPSYVSSNTSTTGTLKVTGYLGSTYCSDTAIGRKNFTVTVQDTGLNDNGVYYDDYYDSSSSADCADISIGATSYSVNESSDSKLSLTLKNNSTKRFEITEIQSTNNGVQLSTYYNEKYTFSGQVSDIILNAKTPSVTTDKVYENSIKVRGKFSDGRTCTFDNIGTKVFSLTVLNQTDSTPNCSGLSISAPTSIGIQNFGSIPFTINNWTNRKVDVYVEGSVEATPTIISLPDKTSITRDATIKISAQNGEVIFRPVIDGCQLNSTRVQINNTASGELAQVSIVLSTSEDVNAGIILSVGIDNPTTKTFDGVLEIQAPNGWTTQDRTVSVVPGQNVFKILLTKEPNAQNGEGKVTFKSNGAQLSTNFNTGANSNLAGLFSFGTNAGQLGTVLLIIIALVILVAMITNGNSNRVPKNQPWMGNKE
ncbi:MAG: hypothetical protein WCW13_06510 [archaeon]